MTENAPAERRKERREMHVDRRKSAIDIVERVLAGVRTERIRPISDDRPPRRSRQK